LLWRRQSQSGSCSGWIVIPRRKVGALFD
jgi:hypothetical protein